MHPVIAASNAPSLKIRGSNETITVAWPASAYYYVLEAKTNTASAPWQGLATAAKVASYPGTIMSLPIVTNFVGNEFAVTRARTNDQQYFRLGSPPGIPVFGFAVFYNSLLEFSYSSQWLIEGPVHANGEIHTGANLPVTFTGTITSTGPISSPPKGGHSSEHHQRVPAAARDGHEQRPRLD
jgi:hypothetical protein